MIDFAILNLLEMRGHNMITYDGKEVKSDLCPGCSYAKHLFTLTCGMAYQDEEFTVSQDWELPINGFYVVCPTKNHVEFLTQLSDQEISKLFSLVKQVESALKDIGVADQFNIVLQEKKGVHLHVWIMPQKDWMKAINKNIMGNLSEIFTWAKNNLRTKENFENINKTTKLLQEKLKHI